MRNITLQSVLDTLSIGQADYEWLSGIDESHYTIKQESKNCNVCSSKHCNNVRYIYAPVEKLKTFQKKLKSEILEKFIYVDNIYGCGGNSTIENAMEHIASNYQAKMDLRNFYPSIESERVKAYFKELGANNEVADFLGRITTVNGKLQQGLPTSTLIACGIAVPFFREVGQIAQTNDITMTQLADDITLSATEREKLLKTLDHVPVIAQNNNFSVKRCKTKTMSHGKSQIIAGVSIANGELRAPRKTRRKARAALHNFQKNPSDEYLRNRLGGYCAHLCQFGNKRDAKFIKSMKTSLSNN